MKKYVLICVSVFCAGMSSAFASKSFELTCEVQNDSTYEENLASCPGIIEKAMADIGCGGKVAEACKPMSPGSPYSSVFCKVTESSCTLPLLWDSWRRAYCPKGKQAFDMSQYDSATFYNSQLYTHDQYEGMGQPVRTICAPK